MKSRFMFVMIGFVLQSLFLTACGSVLLSAPSFLSTPVASTTPDTLTVVINGITTNEFLEGQQVSIQSTSTDPAGISRVELIVDGTVVRTDQPSSPVTTFTVVQTWKATAGSHTMNVRAYSSAGVASDSSPTPLTVLPSNAPAAAPTTAQTVAPAPPVPPTESKTETPVPSASCTNIAVFVTDVTIPDGTLVNAGQVYGKTWQVRNAGTCTWDGGYQLTFLSGDVLPSGAPAPIPNTPPGAAANLTTNIIAPTTPGTHTGVWQIMSPNGIRFGPTLTAVVQVAGAPAPAPAVCSGIPNIASFSVSPSTITVGQSATLSWGLVSNADLAEIDQGIGGVATPGSITVSPGSTTTYTLTAFCGPNSTTAQVTLTVNPSACSGTPSISSFTVSPSTITVGQSATLSWGLVGNADSVSIDQGIGGVATPGSRTVSPSTTTTYTLTAFCGSNSAIAQVTLTVLPVQTATPTPRPTATFTPTRTRTPTPRTPIATPRPSRTPTATPRPRVSPTATPRPRRSPTATPRPSLEPLPKPSATKPPTPTPTPRRRGAVDDTTVVTRCFIPPASGSPSLLASASIGEQAGLAGATASALTHSALASFDTSDLAGKVIESAVLTITGTAGNDRANPGAWEVATVPYMSRDDWANVPSTMVGAISPNAAEGLDVLSLVQRTVSEGEPQLRLRLVPLQGSDVIDPSVSQLSLMNSNICVSIAYRDNVSSLN